MIYHVSFCTFSDILHRSNFFANHRITLLRLLFVLLVYWCENGLGDLCFSFDIKLVLLALCC